MATLYNQKKNEKVHLRSSHLFGRNPLKSDTLLSQREASQIHASIRWTGRLWEIVDHSRNGTMLDGKRMPPNAKVALNVGQSIQFTPDANAIWVVESLTPPASMLLPTQKDEAVVILNNFQLLPDEVAPQASVYVSPTGRWICESTQEVVFLQDGDTIQLGDKSWKFVSQPALETTTELAAPPPVNARGICFNFTVSQNEEHTTLNIAHPRKNATLGERVHHYSLLMLARRRLEDARRGLEAASQGWIEIEQLSHMLGLDPPHLNIQIFRLRHQIAQIWPQDISLSHVIERRRGELRFGAFAFQIKRGSSVEGSFDPARHAPTVCVEPPQTALL